MSAQIGTHQRKIRGREKNDSKSKEAKGKVTFDWCVFGFTGQV